MENNHAKDQAKSQLESVMELVKNYRDTQAQESDSASADERDREEAIEAIQNDALEVCVRSGWQPIGNTDTPQIDEYYILLCTGGPAVRIRGNTNAHGTPDDAIMEYQDWGTPWTELETTDEQKAAMVEYAEQFIIS